MISFNILLQQVLPKVIWEKHVALSQLCSKVPIGYNGTPKIHTQIYPFPSCEHWRPFVHSLYQKLLILTNIC